LFKNLFDRKEAEKEAEISVIQPTSVTLFSEVPITEKAEKNVSNTVQDINENIYMTIGNCSHSGSLKQQEDSFACSDISQSTEKGLAAVVADGMGGLSAGKEVSSYVVSSLITMFESLDYSLELGSFGEQMKKITENINIEICKNLNKFENAGNNGNYSAGSTLAAIFFYGAKTPFDMKAHWVSVGDSRIYLLRGERLYAINEDHDYYNQLLNEHINNDLSLENIHADEQKDSLTSFIGNIELPFIDYNPKGFQIQKEDSFILCTDGVYNAISEQEIVTLVKYNPPQHACENIVRAA